MSDQNYERGKATNGSVYSTFVKLGMQPWEALQSTPEAYRYIKRDADNRPYVTAKDGVRWFVDIPGDKQSDPQA